MSILKSFRRATGTSLLFFKFLLFLTPVFLALSWFGVDLFVQEADQDIAWSIVLGTLSLAILVSAIGFHFIIGKPMHQLIYSIDESIEGDARQNGGEGIGEFASLTRAFKLLQSKQEKNSHKLRRALEALNEIYSTTPTLIFSLDPAGNIAHASTFWRETSGYQKSEVIGFPLTKFLDERSGYVFDGQIMPLLTATGHARDIPLRLRCKSGLEMEVLFSASMRVSNGGADGTAGGRWMFCAMSDVTLLKRAERQLRQVSVTDHLTGVANRADLTRYMNDLFAGGFRENERIAVLFIDLDNFKTVNDTLGHAAGDRVLVEIADRFRLNLRDDDYIARIGGDEFAVICRNVKSENGAVIAAQRLIESIRPEIDFGGQNSPGQVSASVGIALIAAGMTSPVAALKMADEAMYEAKKAGRNTYVLWGQPDAKSSRTALFAQRH